MESYPKRVAENILPLSVAKNLSEAFKEWYFTDCTEDHGDAIEDCELCNQEQLRYHFEIKNEHTKHTLMVGSSCILKFDVAVLDEGIVLEKSKAKRKLNKLMEDMRLKSCINALTKLAEKENSDILSNALDYYLKNKKLTPKFAFVVMWRLKKNDIDHHPSFFKVALRRNKHQDDLEEMEESRVHLIWPCLTHSQKEMAMKFGHEPPRKT